MTYSKEEILAKCNAICKNTLMETLEIEFVDVSDDSLTAKMPVTPRVHQPDGVLHGGATVALAESVGSAAAFVVLKKPDSVVRGIEIAANHVKGVRSGFVYAKATVLHNGRTTQFWQIRVTNEDNDLVSMIKFTTISLPKS
ncbi:MAG: PaaI family thioesterase [Flavobacteriaceae bacterium]|nr:PaaI family thioesterase [Flavobacteriaceae bacterium]